MLEDVAVSTLLYASAALSGSTAVLALAALVVAVVMLTRKAAPELTKLAKTLPSCSSALDYSRMPVEALEVFCAVAGVDRERLAAAYRKDSMERKAVVYAHFGEHAMTRRFIDTSNFITAGYHGEQTILKE